MMEASGNTPIRLAVLYICTGRYNRFWADFYESAKAHLLPHDTEVEYFVFTDDASLSQAPDVHLIHRECHGFPADTLQRFEMFMEGTRFADLVRWGDAATVLKDQGKCVPSFVDPFDKEKGIPHSAVVDLSKAYYNDTYGFVAGKNEVMPYPFGELQLNSYNEETGEGIKQNPGWN